MSVDVQAVKNDIWRVKQKIKDTEGQLAEWKEQVRYRRASLPTLLLFHTLT